MRRTLALLLALGCARSRPTVTVAGPTGDAVRVATTERVCVATVEDARDGTRQYGGSGQAVAARAARALRPAVATVQVLSDRGRAASAACRAHRGRWLVTPTILRWEERAAGWSGAPDVVRVRLVLHDVATDADRREVVFESAARHGLGGRALSGVMQSAAEPGARLLDERFDAAVRALIGAGDARPAPPG